MSRPVGIALAVALLVAAGLMWFRASERSASAAEDLAVVATRATEAAWPEAVRTHYAGPGASLIWIHQPRHREQMAAALDRAALEGISDEELDVAGVREHLVRVEEGSQTERAESELELSSALLRLADVYARGSRLLTDTEVEWRMDRDPEPDHTFLAAVAETGVAPALDSLRPVIDVHDRTVDALARYRTRAEGEGDWPRITHVVDAAVERGDTHPVVAEIRNRLRGGMDDAERALAESGSDRAEHLDDDLAKAIALFQERHGIAVDSVAGPETIAAMNVSLADRIDQLALNLDRFRRLPRDFGERAILVNVAGFELRVLEHNRPTLQMAVVVGQPEWRTNVFSDSIEYLEVNPYWHVPESIEAAETLPRAQEDPNYLTENRISVVAEGDNLGDPIDPSGIDWAEMSADDMPYDFRQEPGPQNALGQIKFMFPNDYNIYLHDTPADALFQEDFRAFSHGCIRLERPFELAEYVLRHGSEYTAEELAAVRESGERTRFDLSTPLPVYIAYLTAWVDDDGRVRFHQDVYDLDEKEEAALGRAS
ncbi:L,D-transpeptidase family protein [Gemmatimonadota bacterium DH-20]|uniref:L,D-transpeptidase family protein n=1 Tax=Gaopeijia maritima TaxID=3119007 RepID=A0ABU9E9P6_9BACT